jgi:hypothetical protein
MLSQFGGPAQLSASAHTVVHEMMAEMTKILSESALSSHTQHRS